MSGKRKSLSSDNDGKVITGSNVILLDIEGTTTSISFVKDELFPYILNNVEQYLTRHWDQEETKADVESLRQQAEADKKLEPDDCVPILKSDGNDKLLVINSVVDNVRGQMGKDRKTTALKQLQGHMWQDAYKTKQVSGHLYEDVLPAMKQWRIEEKTICIYSSGSVAAQKLLFTYSIHGDITENLSDYFDTKVGGKRESDSYTKISEQLKVQPGDVLFLTDIYEEASAAKNAGMEAVIMLRPGNTPLTDEQMAEFNTMSSLNQLEFSTENTIPEKKGKHVENGTGDAIVQQPAN